MAKDRDTDKLRPDANEIAYRTVQAALGWADKPQPPGSNAKNPEAVTRGRKGGKKGGKKRAMGLSAEDRRRAARKAALARWRKK